MLLSRLLPHPLPAGLWRRSTWLANSMSLASQWNVSTQIWRWFANKLLSKMLLQMSLMMSNGHCLVLKIICSWFVSKPKPWSIMWFRLHNKLTCQTPSFCVRSLAQRLLRPLCSMILTQKRTRARLPRTFPNSLTFSCQSHWGSIVQVFDYVCSKEPVFRADISENAP